MTITKTDRKLKHDIEMTRQWTEIGAKAEVAQLGRLRKRPTLGKEIVESKAYKDRDPQSREPLVVNLDINTKTLLTEATGFAPPTDRIDRVQPSATNDLHLSSIIPVIESGAPSLDYLEETTFTNAAAPVAEGGAKPESALGFTARTAAIRVVATTLPITEEAYEDSAALQSTVDNRLTAMLLLTEDAQLVSGSGTAPQMRGFLSVVGIQTQAKGADSVALAILKAITLVRVNGLARNQSLERFKSFPALQESIRFQLRQMRKDLAGEHADTLEVLLVDAVVATYQDYFSFAMLYSQQTKSEITLNGMEQWERIFASKEHRYLRAVETLARVRRLLNLPSPQVNINLPGGQQVNVQGKVES